MSLALAGAALMLLGLVPATAVAYRGVRTERRKKIVLIGLIVGAAGYILMAVGEVLGI